MRLINLAAAASFLCIIMLSTQAFSLDETSSIPDTNAKVLTNIVDELAITKTADNTAKLYKSFSGYLKGDWYAYWISATDLKKFKSGKNQTKLIDLVILNENRVNIITFAHFIDTKQIFYSAKEFVETDSATALSNHTKLKNEAEYKKINEKDNYAMFQKDGYLDYTIYHVKSPTAGITYIEYGIIDLQ
jgi:hypothetical protein